jgi:sigma-B regulation protein RsbU (phosphoserine phosphatase)
MKVLVIEDQPVSAMQIAGALRALGHQPLRVESAAAALQELGQGHYRVLVSDWRMPGLDGLDLCRLIRQRGGDYVYFILVSGADMSDANRDEALAAGVDDFLPKPVNPQDLKMRLHVAERILKFTTQVRELEAILPICGYCKKIRDDKHYWSEVEEYLGTRDGTRFSHGVCPDCYESVMVPQMKKCGIVLPPRSAPPEA